MLLVFIMATQLNVHKLHKWVCNRLGNCILEYQCRPWPYRPRSHHSRHQQIKAIISHRRRCFPCFRNVSILDWPMLEIFWRKNYNISDLGILHVPIIRFLGQFLSYLFFWLLSNVYIFWFCCSQKRENTYNVTSCLVL